MLIVNRCCILRMFGLKENYEIKLILINKKNMVLINLLYEDIKD